MVVFSKKRMASVSESNRLLICVGAAKAGTSSLHTVLSQHPAISCSSPKETDFFITPGFHEKGIALYLNKYFKHTQEHSIYFEADPVYLYAKDGIRNIHQLAPEARIIIMLRNPVKRAYSQYLYRMAYGRYNESFEMMCTHEAERIMLSERDRLEYGCLDRSMYAPQIAEVFKYYSREQVHFILFEDFIRNQQEEVDKVLAWLGLRPMKIVDIAENPGGKPKSLVIARLLLHPKYRMARGIISAMLPKSAARYIYEKILRYNHIRYLRDNKPRLSNETMESLMNIFAEDIKVVEAMTRLNLSKWTRNEQPH